MKYKILERNMINSQNSDIISSTVAYRWGMGPGTRNFIEISKIWEPKESIKEK
jgi:hypothetical protein